QKHEFLPYLAADVGREFGVDAALQAGLQKCLAARRTASVELAEYQPLHRAGLADHTRAADRGCDVADATHDLLWIVMLAQIVVLEHAVLERDDRGVRSHHWPDLLQHRFGVPQFHGEQHEVGDADFGGIIRRSHRLDMDRLRSLHRDALRPHRREMRAVRQKSHVGAAAREPRAEIAANAARTDDRDTHLQNSRQIYWSHPHARYFQPTHSRAVRRNIERRYN